MPPASSCPALPSPLRVLQPKKPGFRVVILGILMLLSIGGAFLGAVGGGWLMDR